MGLTPEWITSCQAQKADRILKAQSTDDEAAYVQHADGSINLIST